MLPRIVLVVLLVLVQTVHAGFGRGFLGGARDSGSSVEAIPPPSRPAPQHQQQQELSRQQQPRQQGTDDNGGVVVASKDGEDVDSEGGFVPLQVLCEVNGFLVPAIIDTGAQITVMSASCAKRCRISNSINTKFSGRAVGVGSSDIIGRIDGLGMRVGPVSFEGRVSVLREARVDFLIGLDLLKRFRSEVNLRDHVLKLQVRDRQYKVPLLNKNQDLEVPGVGGGGEPLPSVGGLEDPDYYGESDFSEDEAPAALVAAAGTGPIAKSEYRSLDNYRSGGSAGGGGGARKSSGHPALSLEGV